MERPPTDLPTDPLPRSSRTPGRGWLGALPRPCALCAQWDRGGLCGDCRQRFVDRRVPRCPRCALASLGGQVCGACLRTPPPFARAVALADYGFPWDRLVGRFKFQQQPELASLLADLLAQEIAEDMAGDAGAGPSMLLPVPLSPARLAERGYNQAWELARRLPARLAPARACSARADLLLRLRDTPHQVGLDRRGRASNLRDALWVPPGAQRALAGARLALVDDVMTTGATATAATLALLAAGAAQVQVWVLARTPEPGD
jgi:ComF family protein